MTENKPVGVNEVVDLYRMVEMAKEIKLLQTMDAKVWVKEFLRINPNTGLDESTMFAWFAKAIGTGYHHRRWSSEKKDRLVERLEEYWLEGEASK